MKVSRWQGRKPPLTTATIEQVVNKTLHEKPAAGTNWSSRKMAAACGLNDTSVQRIWKAHELEPDLVKTVNLSNDRWFAKKVQDIVGLYLNLPEKALVFSVYEKRQIQAFARTQPNRPFRYGHYGTMTRDDKRHGTTIPFAALDVATDRVIGQCIPRHRHQGVAKFPRRLDAETPGHFDVHLIANNYATHKHAKIQAWLKRYVHIEAEANDGLLHDPSPMHEAGHWPSSVTFEKLHTVKRVVLISGEHLA